MRGDDEMHFEDGAIAEDDRRPPLPPDDEGGGLLEVVVTIAAAIALALLVQQFLVKPFRIPSGSMENTLRCGDRVLVDRISYRFGEIERGDVVVFHPPAQHVGDGFDLNEVATTPPPSDETSVRELKPVDTNFIKRVVGLPGEEVEVRDHRAFIDGEALDEPYLRPISDTVLRLDPTGIADWGPHTVPDDAYLMLGDHRDNSKDGRVFWWVPEKFVVGKAFMVYWPPARMGGIPEEDPGNVSQAEDPNCIEGVNDIPPEAVAAGGG